jgi:soluble lytic murein transglycosylase-like protein
MRIRKARVLILFFAFAPLGAHAADPWQQGLVERLDESIERLRAESARPRAAMPRARAANADLLGTTPAAQDGRVSAIALLLQEQGLPSGLTSVVAVESAFDPRALSPKGARGLWQLMPATARRYGLSVEPSSDERLDPAKSTRAAASYLKDLYAQFQDWPLALAAYNAGEDRVAKALSRTGARDFWTLRRRGALPQETLKYVPAVLQKLEAPLHAPAGESSAFEETSADDAPPAGRIAYASTAVNAN